MRDFGEGAMTSMGWVDRWYMPYRGMVCLGYMLLVVPLLCMTAFYRGLAPGLSLAVVASLGLVVGFITLCQLMHIRHRDARLGHNRWTACETMILGGRDDARMMDAESLSMTLPASLLTILAGITPWVFGWGPAPDGHAVSWSILLLVGAALMLMLKDSLGINRLAAPSFGSTRHGWRLGGAVVRIVLIGVASRVAMIACWGFLVALAMAVPGGALATITPKAVVQVVAVILVGYLVLPYDALWLLGAIRMAKDPAGARAWLMKRHDHGLV